MTSLVVKNIIREEIVMDFIGRKYCLGAELTEVEQAIVAHLCKHYGVSKDEVVSRALHCFWNITIKDPAMQSTFAKMGLKVYGSGDNGRG